MNGIEVTEYLNKTFSIPIIYLTSNTDPATMEKAIASKPASFISKPYNTSDLQASISLAFQRFNEEDKDTTDSSLPTPSSIFVKSGEFYHRVNLDEILFVEASGSYCTITTESGEYVLSMNLQNFINKLPRKDFVRVHRSYLVNIQRVEKFDHYSVVVHGRELPISKSNREGVFKHLQRI